MYVYSFIKKLTWRSLTILTIKVILTADDLISDISVKAGHILSR